MVEIATFVTSIIFILTFIPILQWMIRRRKYCQIYDKIPGPKAYPLIGTMWEVIGASRYDLFYILDKRTRAFPDIHRIWVGPNPEVRISKAEYVEKILCSSKHIDKSHSYKFIAEWLGEGLLTSKDARWHKHRKIITPTFHFNILDGFCDIFSEKCEILTERLEQYCGSGEPVDIYPHITKLAMDIICETAMGTKIEAQKDEENEYVAAIYQITELIWYRVFHPWLTSDLIFKMSATGKRFYKTLNVIHGFINKVIQERKLARMQQGSQTELVNEFGQKKRLAFLDLLLEGNKNNDLSDEDIRMEVDTFMFEGHDTTTAAVSWALFLIGLDDAIQDRIVEELDSIFHGSDRGATIKDLNEMKYLERCIKESLRLFPSVSLIGRELSEDTDLGGYKLPAGTTMGLHIYNLHRDERFFPDPEKYDPDRFLPENIENRHPYAYVPFSAGPRNCIGQKFAIYEEKSILSSILRNYKIKSADSRDDVKVLHELITRPRGGIDLFLEKRN